MAEDVVPNKEQPLSGVILCCTSILPELRSQLITTAAPMGAIHSLDLTSEVTHLIVGETNTAKYKYVAKERSDVKVLHPNWVGAVRESWMLGGDTDLGALEERHRFPTFEGLALCLTGFEDMHFRNQLQEVVTTNGGEFRRDLTKSVTHLVARVPEGQKYNFARIWNIKVVSFKWFEDSLERGMILEESLYEPSLPVDQQGVGAWNRNAPSKFKKQAKASGAGAGSQRPRKLRRVASAKLGGQTDGIWTDIVGNEPSAPNHSANGTVEHEADPLPTDTSAKPAVQEPKSFASETTLLERPGSTTQETVSISLQGREETARGIWHGSIFFIHGFNSSQTKILKSHLHSRDAQTAVSLEDLLDIGSKSGAVNLYILVPYNLPRSEIPSVDEDFEPEPETVTDMWIEKCLHSNIFVPPESQITSTPVPRFPIPAFQKERISSTGFSGIDLLHLSKLVTLIGAKYDEYLTPNTTVLVCHNMQPNAEKLRHVTEWKVPAVIADWLWISVQTGERKPLEPYIIPYRRPPSDLNRDNQTNEARNDYLAKNPNGSIEKQEESKSRKPSHQDDASRQATAAPQGASANSSRKPSPSLSAAEERQGTPAPTIPLPRRPSRSNSADPGKSAPLEMAISDLLKQKRNGPKRSNSSDNKDTGSRQPRRRQLLGRASSNSSTLATGNNLPVQLHRGISRGSSIDTMNEDGYGVVVEGVDSPSAKGNSNVQNSFSVPTATTKATAPAADTADQAAAQQSRENRLDFFRKYNMLDGLGAREDAGLMEDHDDDSPEMTQLGYEDPDAAAMREQIMQHAARVNDNAGDEGASAAAVEGEKKQKKKSTTDSSRNLVIGRLQDHELLAGWGGGKRTRSGRER